MRSRRFMVVVMVLVMVCFLIGCQKASLVLKEMGPAKTKAGQAFNVQPDGNAAMWFKTENATKTTVVVWGETQLKTTFADSKAITASITPKELYSKPGPVQVHLFDMKTGMKSNSLTFTIE